MAIFKLKNDNPRQYSETWQSITYALYGLCYYTAISPTLQRKPMIKIIRIFILSRLYFDTIISVSQAAVAAGIIPVFASALSQRSYLEDLDTNSVT